MRGEEPPPQPTVSTEPSLATFEAVASADYVSPSIRASVQSSNFLLLPHIDLREHTGPTFPSGTEELYRYLVDNAPADLKPEIAIADEDYAELAFHDEAVTLATFIVTFVALPLALNLVGNWLSFYLGARFGRSTVKSEVIVIKQSRGFAIRYEGPADTFESIVQSAAEAISNDDD